VTDPYRGGPWRAPESTSRPQPVRPPRPRSGRTPWVTVGLPVAVAAIVALLIVAHLVGDGRRASGPQASSTSPAGRAVPSSDLVGEWSGEGALTRCAGFDDEGCPETLSVSLTIDCSKKLCSVTPFDRSYGTPPLRFEDGSYRASGPVPADVAPTCGGVPTRSALWRLELTVRDGWLGGSYAESTVQGFDCGATGVAWKVVLESR